MTHFKQSHFNYMMKSFHGNGKINRDSNTDSYYTYYREALEPTIVPPCMFKYILFSCSFGEFFARKNAYCTLAKGLPRKLKEQWHV